MIAASGCDSCMLSIRFEAGRYSHPAGTTDIVAYLMVLLAMQMQIFL